MQSGRSSPANVSLPRWAPRRLAAVLGWALSNRRFVFAFCALITLVAKGVHIYAHRVAITNDNLQKWGYSFFAQDIAILVVTHILLNGRLDPGKPGLLRSFVNTITAILVALSCFLGLANICVFVSSGSEVHWKNAAIASDPSGRAVLLSGLFSSLFITGGFLLGALILQIPLFVLFGLGADIICAPFWFLSYCVANRRRIFTNPMTWCRPSSRSGIKYTDLAQHDVEARAGEARNYEFESSDLDANESDADSSDEKEKETLLRGSPLPSSSIPQRVPLSTRLHPRNWPWALFFFSILYAGALAAMVVALVFSILRPHETTYTIMSWTAAVLPFADFGSSSPALHKIQPLFNSGIGKTWDEKTALHTPPRYDWLPKDRVPEGFEDWYNHRKHYVASKDPLKISNHQDDVLAELGDLKGVPIRHVVTIVLESTRKDIFPFKHDNFVEQRLAASWQDGKMPAEAEERLRTLTPTARLLTGDYNDGFEHPEEEKKTRGGLNFNDAYTTSTYTLKSMAGTLCGLTPVVADFNVEYKHHFYQPCLPQVLGVLGTIDSEKEKEEGFRSYPWKSTWMQSVTMGFDFQGPLLKTMGFHNQIDKEYLKSDNAKFGKVNLPDVNYFGMVEEPLLDYIRDEFETAKKDNGRVLIGHITSTSHHPYSMPADEKYVQLGNGLDDLSKYVNAIGYDDRWLGKILHLLDELGVANETLLVLAGDHGLSIPENGKLPTYYNPNTISNHVPIVLSHPLIPPITLNSSVSTRQIVPTILDLLAETGSLSTKGTRAARDLIANYEGQSMIRPVHQSGESVRNWHFTTINPGGAQVGIRDAFNKKWHLVIPTVDNVEWYFSADEHDASTVVSFDFHDFLRQIETKHNVDAARWAEEAAFIGRWWVEENSKRWRYGPYATL